MSPPLFHCNALDYSVETPGCLSYLWSIRRKCSIKCEHLWRHLIGSCPFLGSLCLIGWWVHDHNLFLSRINFEERAGLCCLQLWHRTHTHHHFNLERRRRWKWGFQVRFTGHWYDIIIHHQSWYYESVFLLIHTLQPRCCCSCEDIYSGWKQNSVKVDQIYYSGNLIIL